jgi:hypothetical protein
MVLNSANHRFALDDGEGLPDGEGTFAGSRGNG